MGTFPRVTHPSAADTRKCPLDLHVLSLPPAFALSQDQTLRLRRSIRQTHRNQRKVSRQHASRRANNTFLKFQHEPTSVSNAQGHQDQEPQDKAAHASLPHIITMSKSMLLRTTTPRPADAGQKRTSCPGSGTTPGRTNRRRRDDPHLEEPSAPVNIRPKLFRSGVDRSLPVFSTTTGDLAGQRPAAAIHIVLKERTGRRTDRSR